MLRIVKVGGMTIGSGVVLGLGVVGWMVLHRPEAVAVKSSGGSVVLDASSIPTPTPAGSLSVLSPATVSESGGNASGLISSTTTAPGSTPSTPAPSGAAPDQADFHQYDSYLGKTSAYFGDVVVGTGNAVVAGSVLTVNYRGWLTDGTLFDDSYPSKQGFTFTEGEHHVITGWEEGLFGMKAGGKRRLIVPPASGYGAAAHGPVPANSVLVFDVELESVK